MQIPGCVALVAGGASGLGLATATAVIVVGDVLAADGFSDSYLYSSGRRRGSRH